MEELSRLQASRRAHKAHLTKLSKKSNDIMADNKTDEMAIATLNTSLEQFIRKRDLINEIDEKIAAKLTDPEDLESEIFESEELSCELAEKVSHIRKYIELSTSLSRSTESTPQNDTSPSDLPPVSQNTVTEAPVSMPPQSSTTTTPPPPPTTSSLPTTNHQQATTTVNSSRGKICKLPKLTLPVFSGNPLNWQSFWDSFEAAVHKNPALDDIERFNYLKSQLEGEAHKAITGFPLTSNNYEEAVNLLKERFGQPHKVVNAHMQALLDIPRPNENHSSLQGFYDTLETHMRGLASLGKAQESYGDLLIPIILGKLPNEFRKNLAREHGTLDWTIEQIRTAIKKELRVLEAGQFINSQAKFTSGKEITSTITSSFHTGVAGHSPPPTQPQTRRLPPCVYCKKNHSSNNCQVVTDVQQRLAIIKESQLCFNCLGHHKASQCRSRNRCKHCHRKHHSSLCNGGTQHPKSPASTTTSPNPMPSNPKLPNSTPPSSTPTNHSSSNPSTSQQLPPGVHSSLAPITPPSFPNQQPSNCDYPATLLKTAVATVNTDSSSTEANILFDEGAQRSFISQLLATKLGLCPSKKETINLSSFEADKPTQRSLPVATINIQTDACENIPLQVLVVPRIATPIQNKVRTAVENISYLQGLKLAHPVTTNENFDISLLVGADHYWDVVQDHIIRGNGPTAMQSKLGYLLSGPIVSSSTAGIPSGILNVMISHQEEDNQLERFWNLESLGITEPHLENSDSNLSQEYQNSAITREKDGSYTAKFPWKHDHPPLPSNISLCEKRTRSTIQRLNRTPGLLNTYTTIMKEQEQRGFIEKVPSTASSLNTHYIPHHPVSKESSTTPIRIVYDCSCRKSPDQASLNDCLNAGPPLLNDMTSILLRFRSYNYGIIADIEKAFLHLNLHEDDRDYTRFLWLSNPEDPDSAFETYRFKVVPFGSTSSPFMLNATLQHHLDQFSTPVSNSMKENMYVDNILSGSDTDSSAVQYYDEARSIMSDAKFNLRSWASNSTALQERATGEQTADGNIDVNALGLRWNVSTDTLALATKKSLPVPQPLITKREVLQQSSSIFDPLGMITPVTVRAKIFMQQLWQQSIDWDEPLDENLQQDWIKISDDLQAALNTVIPRRYHNHASPTQSAPQLHCFVDASTKAYGAAAYLKQDDETSFIMAKTRVAPLKQLTLPQLELMAALVGARLASFIRNALKNRFKTLEVFLWSDSQIVLHWLNSSKPHKQFNANRIKSIKALFPSNSWHYCPTQDNPADVLTRGSTASHMQSSTLWSKGPSWLTLSPQHWPTWSITPPTTSLAISLQTSQTIEHSPGTIPSSSTPGVHHVVDISNYSSLTKVIRVTAYVMRFIHNASKRQSKQTGSLTSQEISRAENCWIRSCQQTAFQSELHSLTSKRTTHPSLVKQLRLFVDDQHLIRCGGRIHNAPISEATKFPLLLPTNHQFTTLVVYAAHKNQLHSGVNSTLTAIRERFWIPRARQVVRKLLHKCVICRKQGGKPYTVPDPAPLPQWRLQDSAPFTVTGVDFTGPLYIKTPEAEKKAYICLFTCATTRAVHLEVVEDLSEETFLRAFRRFTSRKSLPRKIVSDNALTYLSAAEELRRLFKSTLVKETLGRQGVEWSFIPKRAPWYGGFWERLIGLTKNALKKVLGRAHVTLSSLQTIVVEIEAILNDRPLTYISSDIQDEEPLTPSHLLYGRRITSLPHANVEDDEINDPEFGNITEVTKRAQKQAVLLKHFRSRWKAEYLTSLREFHRTSGNNKQTVRTGEVVLIHDDNARTNWRLAVIESVVKGKDGLIRAANIRMSNGRTNRPIAKLYPLEVRANVTAETNIEDNEPTDTSTEKRCERRSKRSSAKMAMEKIKRWTEILNAPPEDV